MRRAQGCLNERMPACAWISWLPCFVFTNSLNGSLSLNYEREKKVERDRVSTTTRRDGSLVINERDAAKYSNAGDQR